VGLGGRRAGKSLRPWATPDAMIGEMLAKRPFLCFRVVPSCVDDAVPWNESWCEMGDSGGAADCFWQ
jgi:hypothetical protein